MDKTIVAYNLARNNGYEGRLYSKYGEFLDPLFWQALGKSLGWKVYSFVAISEGKIDEWEVQWHRFIDHLISGGDAESFFSNLIK